MPLARRVSLLCAAAMLLTGAAFAKSTASRTSSQTPAASPSPAFSSSDAFSPNNSFSSSDWNSSLPANQLAEFHAPEASALPSAPAASAGQDNNHNGGGGGSMFHRAMSGFAFEGGFGFNSAISNSIGTGWNLLIGAGVHVNPHLMVPIEYQFIRTGLAQYLINAAGSQGGNTHIWSFTLDPTFDIAPKASNDFYVKGGGGFYRKVTNFTDPVPQQYCDYFYGCGYVNVNTVVGHFSSNQGGWNIGGGYYHRFGGIYGTGKMKFFAEARYLDVLTPAIGGGSTSSTATAVPADTKLIPVTFGFSW
jgi:hypothetical protein